MSENIKHWIVYMYTFPNNKRYIGKTCKSLISRQGNNFKRYKSCTLLWNAIQKYGIESIHQEILFEKDTTTKESCEIEQYYIEFYKTNANKYNNPSFGYNLTSGGDGLKDWKPSPERYQQLCEQLKLNAIKNTGSKRSEESKEKMRQAKLGKTRGSMPESQRKKISIANSRENMSEETRICRSESKKKKVVVTNNETGENKIYPSLYDVSIEFSVAITTVSRWCNKTRNPTINFTFNYYIPPTTTEREDTTHIGEATV